MATEAAKSRAGRWALAWLAVVTVAATALGLRMDRGLSLNADIQALLPDSQAAPLQQRALAKLDQSRNQQLLFLVGHASPEQARAAADHLAADLAAQPAISKATARPSHGQLEAIQALYAPVEGLLLTRSGRQALAEGQLEPLLQRALRQLYSPQAWLTPISPARDPLLLQREFLENLPQPQGQLRWSDGYLETGDSHGRWVLVQAHTRDGAFSQARPEALIDALAQVRQTVTTQWPETQILNAGVPLHGAHAAARAQWEMRVIGGLSLLAVVLLVLAVFRSGRPLLLTLAAIGTGLLLALSVCSWLFERLHLITLVVGASLIGVTVDYAFHYFATAADHSDSPRSVLSRVGPAISLGLLTTALAYAALLAAPFPGLRQMAVFSICGLLGAWWTVLCLFPWAAAGPARPPAALNTIRARILQPSRKARWAVLVITAVLAVFAGQLTTRDSARSLYRPPADLMQQDQALNQRIAAVDPSRLFVISAADSESWLQTNEALLEALAAQPPAAQAVSIAQAVPSSARQHQDRLALAPVYAAGGLLDRYATASGLSREAQDRLLNHYTDAGILSLNQWLQSPVSENLRGLWAGADADGASGVVLLSDIRNEAALRQIADQIEGVVYLNRVTQLTELLATLRRDAAALLALGIALAGTVLMLRYGVRAGLRTVLPAALAMVWVLGGLALMGIGFSLFHLFALLLVLGMGLDYAIFLRESIEDRAATGLAIGMAALTTLLAFGLLALSQTPALQDFGQAVALGIAATLVLAWSLAPAADTRSGDAP